MGDLETEQPKTIATIPTTCGYIQTMEAAAERLVLRCKDCINVYNISSPTRPTLYGQLNISNRIKDIEINDNVVYLTTDNQGVVILDISQPSQPVIIDTIDTPGDARNVFISGGHLYIADGYEGVRIVK
jgi:hypothetical protein